ncbi:RAMP superfamily CRISPR-associated protein [Desulfonatronovibrio hydrogenovorans]|uniref:RAMP superfamily CRISPR-associated protein n=1 Tax=Desulfonatronovibrio hydrogenovorans TaxID=53245 RepID=UPI00048C8D91|nr:RAMP superfamily CRISPR-associated protein [Desulfonatronovibrio hydrogenovorans]
MNVINNAFYALKIRVQFRLQTPLSLKSGYEGDLADSSIEKTPDNKMLHINGYVWASLMRRSLMQSGQEELARLVGSYPDDEANETGVSPVWCSPGFCDLKALDIRPGNRIDRKYGTVAAKALYSEELVSPGIEPCLNAVIFCEDKNKAEEWARSLPDALAIIDAGLETIGGNWSYGLGRLAPLNFMTRTLNLTNEHDLDLLWSQDVEKWDENKAWEELSSKSRLVKGKWSRLRVKARVADGQLLAVSTQAPPLEFDLEKYGLAKNSKLPDTFVYQEKQVISGRPESRYIIPGKAFRQAVLSRELERRLRSQGEQICYGDQKSSNNDQESSKRCDCTRCRWFGNTEWRGLVSVSDAEVIDPDIAILNRIQLCEHSMQNMNLFSGAYLKQGEFELDIIVDMSRNQAEGREAYQAIKALCEEMKPEGSAPPGWYRLGKTSTCTGQIEIFEIIEEKPEQSHE